MSRTMQEATLSRLIREVPEGQLDAFLAGYAAAGAVLDEGGASHPPHYHTTVLRHYMALYLSDHPSLFEKEKEQ